MSGAAGKQFSCGSSFYIIDPGDRQISTFIFNHLINRSSIRSDIGTNARCDKRKQRQNLHLSPIYIIFALVLKEA